MDLTARSQDASTIVTPSGRIDHATADAFAAALQPHLDRCKAGAPQVIIDMAGVDYISSVGLRVLMVAAKQAQAQSGRIVMAGLTPMVREVFEISRFDMVFTLFDRIEDALSASGASG